MKKHAIIPIFIPHCGCPNDCVFCNQKAITARQADVTPADVRRIIDTYLPTLTGRGLETIEVAFFGGSFTGLPIEEQSAFLSVAAEYKSKSLIDKIHMSTRPDYIDTDILDNLRRWGADSIELGVQSFDDSVLAAAGRGHTSEAVYDACSMIHSYGFELGIQLMIGLPGDSLEKCLYSAQETVRMHPSIARLYPTIVLQDTALYEMTQTGLYHPLTTGDAVAITKEMYKILAAAGINIIRVGLKSTDLISGSGAGTDQTWGHTYHPAFRQLVEGEIARESIEAQLLALRDAAPGGTAASMPNEAAASTPSFTTFTPIIATDSATATNRAASAYAATPEDATVSATLDDAAAAAPPYDAGNEKRRVTVYANGVSFSNMIGNSACNRKYFETTYPQLSFRFAVDDRLPNMTFHVSV